MVTSNPVQNCAMVQLYCSEQISIPESFPNILKTYAKAAIRTQPYDILLWSAAYFRCLANDAPPPAKLRLERECRQGNITKGYLKTLIAQVGKGFFISRCTLQDRWKALCLPEDHLLKYLSLCRMLNWTQVHWLKVVAVMASSLTDSFEESMTLVCELLTDDVEGGMARIPYWMFKLCYIFVAKLDCSQEQCFVNGQLVLPWGELEAPTLMDKLPRVLSATMLKDTIIKTCKAKLQRPPALQGTCTPPSPSATCSTIFMVNSKLDNPKELLTQCEDFDTIMLLLLDSQEMAPLEEDFIGPHHISENQIINAQKLEMACEKERKKQSAIIAERSEDYLKEESFKILREVGPPWTWLHQFAIADCNTASYNCIDQRSIRSDVTPDIMSARSYDIIKEAPIHDDEEETPEDSSSSCDAASTILEEKKCSLQDLENKIQEASEKKLCNVEEVSSIISLLRYEEVGVLQRAGEPFTEMLNIKDVILLLKQSQKSGLRFKTIDELMNHVRANLLGDIQEFPKLPESVVEEVPAPSSYHTDADDEGWPDHEIEPGSVPSDWKEAPPKDVKVAPSQSEATSGTESKELHVKGLRLRKIKDEKAKKKEESKPDELTQIFETTVGIPPEQQAKMPKFCFETKDEDELILGLVPLEEPEEVEEEEDWGSTIPESGELSRDGYIQDCSSLIASPTKPLENVATPDDMKYYCCLKAPTLEPKPYVPPPLEFNCCIQPLPGIGPVISDETIDLFLSYLRIRSHGQHGLVHPRNFKEEACPYMTDRPPKETCPHQAEAHDQPQSPH